MPLERVAARWPTPADLKRRELLRWLCLDELEALEGAVLAEETGRPLTGTQGAAGAAWERASEAENGGRIWAV